MHRMGWKDCVSETSRRCEQQRLPQHQDTKTEMVQRHAARFCHNDYKTIEKGCMSEIK